MFFTAVFLADNIEINFETINEQIVKQLIFPMIDIPTRNGIAATLPPSKAGQLPSVPSIHCVKKNMAFRKIIYQLLPPPSRREAYPLLTTFAKIFASDKVTQSSLREGGGKNRIN